MMVLMSAVKLLFLHMCFHAVVVAKLRMNDKTQQRSLIASSPALDVTIADISVKYNNVNGYNVHGCLDLSKATQSKYSVQVQYEIRNSGDAGFIAPSRFVDYAACGTPAILNFLSLTIEGGRDSSGNPYPTIELSSFATCVIDDGNTADAAACVRTTDFVVKPSQSYGISQGGSYGVSKTVRVKFPLTPEQFNALSNSAPATLTFTLSVNKAISPNGAAGVVAAVDGSKLKGATWQATGQGTSVPLFIRPPSAAPSSSPTIVPSTTPTTVPTSAPTTVPPTTTPTIKPTTIPTPTPAAVPSVVPTTVVIATSSGSSVICDNIIGPEPNTTSIGANRYRYDQSLARVCLTTNVQSIGNYAFANNGETTSISSIYFPSSVKIIGFAAFWPTKLTSVTFAGDIESIESYAFHQLNYYIQTPQISLVFPGAVGTIGYGPFWNSRVASLSFGGTVGYIGQEAFRYNYIQTVTFPAGLSFLGDCAFCNNALTSVTFRGAVAIIGNYVFGATSLQTVYHPRSWTIPVDKFPNGVTYFPTD